MSCKPSLSKSVFPSVHRASNVPAALLGGSGSGATPLVNISFADAILDPAESIANRSSAIPLSTSILPGPQLFDSSMWAAVGGTATRTGLQDDEAGTKLGTRLQMADGVSVRYAESANGIQQTFRFRAKSNTGSAHDVQVGSWLTTAQRTTVSVGTDWTTVSVTMASGNHHPWIGAVGNAVDITIDGASVTTVAGATELAPSASAGHCYNGSLINAVGGRPAKQGARAIVAASSMRSRISLPEHIGVDDICFIFSANMTSSPGGNRALISSVLPASSVQVRTNEDKFSLVAGASQSILIQPFTMVGRGWALIAIQRRGSTGECEVFINGDLIQTTPFSTTSQFVQAFDLGRFATSSGNFQGNIGDVQIYNQSLTPAQHRAIADEWAVSFAPQAEAMFSPASCHVFIGDSITAGAPLYTYVDSMASTLLASDVLPCKIAVSGETLEDLEGRLDQYRSLVKPGRTNTVSVMIGYNDFNSGLFATAAEMWPRYLAFLQSLSSSGFDHVIAITNTPTGSSIVNNKLSDLATLIRDGEATGPYVVADLRADSSSGDGTPATGYADNVHPNNARQDLIAGFLDDIILALH